MRALLVVSVTTLLAGCATAPGQFLGLGARNPEVCKRDAVPAGHVIVGESSVQGCCSRLMNAWLIKIPGETEAVCDASPVPAGYRVLREASLASCPLLTLPDGVTWTMKNNGKVVGR